MDRQRKCLTKPGRNGVKLRRQDWRSGTCADPDGMPTRQVSRLILTAACLLPALLWSADATITETEETMQTYPFGDPSPLADFGRIYPYARFDGYSTTAVPQRWTMVKLENDFLAVLITPQIGGKVWAAWDKVNGRNFIYRNPVVKFRDVGLRGPWTAGGLEFNFGIIGHAPTCASPVNYCLRHDDHGGVSCVIGALDAPSRTQWRVIISLARDQAALGTEAMWYNPTVFQQSCYQWMTAAAEAQDDLVVSHPGHHYLEHGGTAHPWPIDAAGHDLSHYHDNAFGDAKSYHVIGAQAEWFGGYYSDRESGYGHWSLFGDKPGQKVWLWSLSRDGAIWRDLLTDAPAPQYIEMQSGLMHSQADDSSSATPFKHAAMEPGAALHWNELWFPLNAIGGLVDASPWGALNVRRVGDQLIIGLCPLRLIDEDLRVTEAGREIHHQHVTAAPLAPTSLTIDVAGHGGVLGVEIGDHVLSWHSDDAERQRLNRPLALTAAPDPASAESLFTDAQEHQRDRDYALALASVIACLKAEPRHLRGLTLLAELRNRRGESEEALTVSRQALELDATDAAANFVYGVANAALSRYADAKDGFAWAARSMAYRSSANAQLAILSIRDHDWWRASAFAQRGADSEVDGLQCRFLQAVIARLSGLDGWLAPNMLANILARDPLHDGARFEHYLSDPDAAAWEAYAKPMRGETPEQDNLELAYQYEAMGRTADAIRLLSATSEKPMVLYALAYLSRSLDSERSDRYLERALTASVRSVFPARVEEIAVLRWAGQRHPHWKSTYYLGLLLWSIGREDEARLLVNGLGETPDEAAFYLNRSRLHPAPTEQALVRGDLLKAKSLDAGEWRASHLLIRMHLDDDDTASAAGIAVEAHQRFPLNQVLSLDAANALVRSGRYHDALELLDGTIVLPSEGASDGRTLFRRASLLQAVALLASGDHAGAETLIAQARTWPEHLGSGRPYDTDERIEEFLLARCRQAAGDAAGAKQAYEHIVAFSNQQHPGYGSVTLIQAMALRELGAGAEAQALLADWRVHASSENVYCPWALAVFNGDRAAVRTALLDPLSHAERSPWRLSRRQSDFPVMAAIAGLVLR
jgi:tetratricopeptide (TPR) repeat protein